MNISPYRIVQALKKKGIGSGLSEQKFSDAAQQAVAGNSFLRFAKEGINMLLKTTGLGTSIQAVYVKEP